MSWLVACVLQSWRGESGAAKDKHKWYIDYWRHVQLKDFIKINDNFNYFNRVQRYETIVSVGRSIFKVVRVVKLMAKF
jgi:hypothetical protein